MVLPFLAMAAGGVLAAVGASQQAKATNRGIEKANEIPLVETSNLNLGKLVEESEKAGFNPLTVLRAGGVAGYATHTTTGHNAHLFAQRQSPGGAFLSGIGNTISQVGGAVLQNSQHMASLNTSLRVAEISALPSFGSGGFGGVGSGPAYGGAGRLGLPSSDRWSEEIPGVTNPMHEGWNWESNPFLSDVETGWEARGGDLMGALAGALTVGGDVLWNVGRFGQFTHDVVGPAVREWLTGGSSWSDLFGSKQRDIPSITVYGPGQ